MATFETALIARLKRKYRYDMYVLISSGQIMTRGIEKGRWLPGLYARRNDPDRNPVIDSMKSCALDIINGHVKPKKSVLIKKFHSLLS